MGSNILQNTLFDNLNTFDYALTTSPLPSQYEAIINNLRNAPFSSTLGKRLPQSPEINIQKTGEKKLKTETIESMKRKNLDSVYDIKKPPLRPRTTEIKTDANAKLFNDRPKG